MADALGLRPTPDRVRETLFNWLAADLSGASVLDLFAGTGALGLEALSRGAAQATFVELQKPVVKNLRQSIETLGAGQVASLQQQSSQQFLAKKSESTFNLVFLDPPYQAQLLVPTLTALPAVLASHHRVYFELPKSESLSFPAGWRILKDKQAGAIRFGLLEYHANESQQEPA